MLKKILLFSCCFLFFLLGLKAQDITTDSIKKDTVWKFGGVAALNFSQVALTNWAAGGQSSISGNTFVNIFANYSKDNNSWENTLELGYGLIKQEGESLRKSDDRIELTSKYGRKLWGKWSASTFFSFKTQFAPGYNYPNDSVRISNFLAPAYVLLSTGLEYKPSKFFSVFIAPVTGRLTIVNDDSLSNRGEFGVKPAVYDDNNEIVTPGKKTRLELGGFFRMIINKELMKNITLQSKLELFSNYIENPQNIDVNWETLITMKINKFFSANLATHLIYDDDINISVDENNDGIIDAFGPRIQFKEVFGLGLTFKF